MTKNNNCRAGNEATNRAAMSFLYVRVRMAGNINYRRGWAALEIEKWQC